MFTKLFVPLDRSVLAEQAMGHAAEIARLAKIPMELSLVHHPALDSQLTEPGWNADDWDIEDRYLAEVAAELRAGARVEVTTSHLRGDVANALTARAVEIGADLIVMSSHGRTGFNRMWLGSVADAVVRRAECPVLLFRWQEEHRHVPGRALFNHVLITLDGSEESNAVIAPACDLARLHGAAVSILRVLQPVPIVSFDVGTGFDYGFPPMVEDIAATEALVEQTRTELTDLAYRLSDSGLNVVPNVSVHLAVARTILEFCNANGVDCIAMATHGRGASRMLLGSVADKVLRGSRVPMLMQHPVKRASPVEETRTGAPADARPLAHR